MADDEILKGEDATLEGIAQAGQVLKYLNQLNEYSKVHACRSASKLMLHSMEDASLDVAEVYFKAEIFRFF
jgi:hypothetical protein